MHDGKEFKETPAPCDVFRVFPVHEHHQGTTDIFEVLTKERFQGLVGHRIVNVLIDDKAIIPDIHIGGFPLLLPIFFENSNQLVEAVAPNMRNEECCIPNEIFCMSVFVLFPILDQRALVISGNLFDDLNADIRSCPFIKDDVFIFSRKTGTRL